MSFMQLGKVLNCWEENDKFNNWTRRELLELADMLIRKAM